MLWSWGRKVKVRVMVKIVKSRRGFAQFSSYFRLSHNKVTTQCNGEGYLSSLSLRLGLLQVSLFRFLWCVIVNVTFRTITSVRVRKHARILWRCSFLLMLRVRRGAVNPTSSLSSVRRWRLCTAPTSTINFRSFIHQQTPWHGVKLYQTPPRQTKFPHRSRGKPLDPKSVNFTQNGRFLQNFKALWEFRGPLTY